MMKYQEQQQTSYIFSQEEVEEESVHSGNGKHDDSPTTNSLCTRADLRVYRVITWLLGAKTGDAQSSWTEQQRQLYIVKTQAHS